MICKKCGKDYSDNVYPYHVERCKKEKPSQEEKPVIEEKPSKEIIEDEKVTK